ncbi:winged helix-turn-helix transcriptional regulator [Dactylosporangium sp. NPDC051541]|uniref:winged helix-turn-helix transcriptional regulator n=1 Tax=Dactylosporangium sp. NPDC051541 TaxID=3363977 RepID=UPI0037BAAF4F
MPEQSAFAAVLSGQHPHHQEAGQCRHELPHVVARRLVEPVEHPVGLLGEDGQPLRLSDRLLSQRLKELETFDLLRRDVIPSTPVQILYEPSTTGAELVNALRPLIAWSATRLQDQ